MRSRGEVANLNRKGLVQSKGNLKAGTCSHRRLQHESDAGVHVVAADVEGKQAPACADGVEDDRPAVFAETIAA